MVRLRPVTPFVNGTASLHSFHSPASMTDAHPNACIFQTNE